MISAEEFRSVVSEIQSHKQMLDHNECELCRWIEHFVDQDLDLAKQLIFNELADGIDSLDILYYMYTGFKIGRRQALAELTDLNETD